jgi:hypothetical protein
VTLGHKPNLAVESKQITKKDQEKANLFVKGRFTSKGYFVIFYGLNNLKVAIDR